MKLTESRLRSIVREELSRLTEARREFEALQNTNISLRPKMPHQEFADYEDLWPLVRAMKKNGVFIGNWVVSPESYDRGDDIPTEAEIVGFEIEGNAADILLALSRMVDSREVSQIHHLGEMGIEKGRIYIDSAEEGTGFPSMRLGITDVDGEIRDEYGHTARSAVVRKFSTEFRSRGSGSRPVLK